MGFLKSFLASLLAIFVTFFLVFIIVMAVVISSSRETEPFVRKGTVLEVKMGSTLLERPPSDPFAMLFSDPSRVPVTLRGLENNLLKAAADERIDGVWFKINNITAPWPHLIALREKMMAFREESGKFIYVSTDDIGFNEQSFFLATAADSIFSPPETFFEFDGFFIQAVFFKDMLNKIGVETEIFRTGEYKSAVEPFMRNDLSAENEEQLQSIVDNVADIFLAAVSERTGKSRPELDAIMNESPVLTSKTAFEIGFIDKLAYPDELEERLKNRINENDDDKLRTVSFQRYNRVKRSTAGVEKVDSKDKIAVIYATGNIMPEFDSDSFFPGSEENITARNFGENLDAALEDDDVKAIVLRISSPGGAGTTSDLIWHQIRQATKKKPVIASFGSVAASGGYYIGMAADTIVASAQTITGSIGVFGMVMNMQELLNEKMGIHFDAVTTHEQALWISPDKPMSATARAAYQQFVDDFYETFLERTALSRNMDVEEVRKVAGGRVWTGTQAVENGLVDIIGELPSALAIAAEKAGIDQYKIETFPKPKTIFDLFSGDTSAQIRQVFQPGIKQLEQLDPIIHMLNNDPRAVIARIPFDHKIY